MRFPGLLGVAAVGALAACSSSTTPTNLSDFSQTVNVGMMNQSQSPVNMWLGHSTTAPAGSDVEPAGLRWSTATFGCFINPPMYIDPTFNPKSKVRVTVRTSSGATTAYTLSIEYQDCHDFYVVWNGAGVTVQ